ncbi:hypothetical protein EDEG_00563 [Edhazardia aedis USNM 41457]|uniref:TEP-1 C-terminal beta-propeller domain-containing protein n=1 Tax=Edhazardia aedis (strain USNM 41457) TaxID=1003232 RepID=J8ZNE7_EDHAE|nr:hypothetical protein EDEG_00563 [Edhazardia aedis USNM 41457]|eukprot:EJW01203.1 hypothetical protein EDEG_00563 [Edhazardia aedis USNM 41457]
MIPSHFESVKKLIPVYNGIVKPNVGNQLITSRNNTIFFIDPLSGKIKEEIIFEHSISSFLINEQNFYVGTNEGVLIDKKKDQKNVLHNSKINIILQVDKMIITGSSDMTVKIHDSNTYGLIAKILCKNAVTAIAIRNMEIIVGDVEGNIYFYHLKTKKLKIIYVHRSSVTCLKSFQNCIYSSSTDGYICRITLDNFDPQTEHINIYMPAKNEEKIVGKLNLKYLKFKNSVNCFLLLNNYIYVSTESSIVHKIDYDLIIVEERKIYYNYRSRNNSLTGRNFFLKKFETVKFRFIDFYNGFILTTDEDEIIFTDQNFQIKNIFFANNNEITDIKTLDRFFFIATCSGRFRYGYIDDNFGEFCFMGKMIEGHTDSIMCISTFKNKILTCSRDGSVILWKINDGLPINHHQNNKYKDDIEFSKDGSYHLSDMHDLIDKKSERCLLVANNDKIVDNSFYLSKENTQKDICGIELENNKKNFNNKSDYILRKKDNFNANRDILNHSSNEIGGCNSDFKSFLYTCDYQSIDQNINSFLRKNNGLDHYHNYSQEQRTESYSSMEELEVLKKITPHTQSVNSCFLAEDFFVTVGKDCTMQIFKILIKYNQLHFFDKNDDCQKYELSNNYDSKIKQQNTNKLLKNASNELTQIFAQVIHKKEINNVKIHLKRRIIATASQDKTIKLFKYSGETIATLIGHRKGVLCIEFGDSILISCSSDGTIRVWSLNDFSCLKTLDNFGVTVLNIKIINERTLFASDALGVIKIWDIKTLKSVKITDFHSKNVWGLDLAKFLITADIDGFINFAEDVTNRIHEQKNNQKLKIKEDDLLYEKYFSEKNFSDALKITFRKGDMNKSYKIIVEWLNFDGDIEKIFDVFKNDLENLLIMIEKWMRIFKRIHISLMFLSKIIIHERSYNINPELICNIKRHINSVDDVYTNLFSLQPNFNISLTSKI